MKRSLALFDIDGTLMTSGGAGRAAMAQAARDVFGRPDMFSSVSFAGSLDPIILAAALEGAGLTPDPRRIGRLRCTYLRRLRRTIFAARGTAHPGAAVALRRSAERAAVGLLTGNFRPGARIKLERYDLWSLAGSGPGAFGGDATTRGGMVEVAWRRALRRGVAAERVVVIGDTPADVEAARVAARLLAPRGVTVMALCVRTGHGAEQALVDAGPDLIVDDLEVGLPALLDLL